MVMPKVFGLARVGRYESIGIPINRYHGDGIELPFQTHPSVKTGLAA